MQNTENIYEYARKLGSNHNNIIFKSKTYNYKKNIEEYIKNIKKAYDILNLYNELNIPINIPGQWLLDNIYIIEKEVTYIQNELNNLKYSNLPKVDNNLRINILAEELVKYTDGNINVNNIRNFLYGYSKSKYISLQELWIFPLMIKIELIKKIYELSIKILDVHEQKYKVEKILERFVNNINKSERKFNLKVKKNKNLEINMPFIEYMAYKLKELDKDGLEYIDVFDEEVLKLGITVDEIVSRQHFDVVTREVAISNCILSLKNINNIDFSKEFENISEIDVILSKEKSGIYSKMDYDTLNMYRKEVYKISKSIGISERYICNKILELCDNSKDKKSHCGYYIIDEGKNILLKELGIKVGKENKKHIQIKSFAIYLLSIFSITLFVTILISFIVGYSNNSLNFLLTYILTSLTIIIPISQIVIYFIDKILLKSVNPKILPSMDFEKKVPDESKTFVIIPTILNSTKKVYELIENLETYYLVNKQDNIFFALLGDCTESKKQKEEIDTDIINTALNEVKRLNEKYNFSIPKFHFLYRDRVYNEKQESYLGWERKRGLITQFNRFLIYGENGNFNTNTINREEIPNIKYILTIDADTQVGINNISKLIGIISHPLNKPVLNKDKTCVIDGYGILQPRINNSIECANKNIFSKIYGGYGGIDIYTNAVSDIYQDMWSEGIFTGKGIYDLEVFSQVLDKQIPENVVLSHDLLEGSFLRCGLVTNVQFIDSYPSRYNNYIVRQNRWLRGDIQISRWLKENNSLNTLSKWKILDNIRRGLLDISLFFLSIIGPTILNIKWTYILALILLVYLFPTILDTILNIKNIFKRNNKNYSRVIGNIEGNIYKTFFELLFLPYKAINNIEVFIKTIYRLKISKKHLLDWLTAEDAEKTLGSSLKTYINDMYISLITSGILITLAFLFSNSKSNIIYCSILGILWSFSPIIAWYISKEKKEKNDINEKDREFLNKVSYDTWQYFKDYINQENNYLIPDNYQEDRKNKIVDRTSSTNIGLSFIAIMTAYDLKFITKEECFRLINNILDTIDKLEKYRGNLYNWYNIKTLKPLNDNISSVDNGNYIAYLYVLKSFCIEVFNDEKLIKKIEQNINMIDFSFLYDNEKNLFSIEYNVRTGELSKSYYDLLASEARILSYVAIAKGDIPYKHWQSLSRNLVQRYGYTGLLSWTGTSFEYFMPYELMSSYKYSLLDETYDFVIMNQMKYVSKKQIPWGISESAFNLYDMEYNYQYKAFGIPTLGLKRGLKDDLVISPYASILALPKRGKVVLENMKKLIDFNSYGKYGYYDAIDFTNSRLQDKKYAQVKTFMAHHQGLILMSINNALNKNIFQKRFEKNVEIKSIKILLQEKINNMNLINNKKNENIIYQEKEEKEEANYIYERIIENNDKVYNNVLSNNNYLITCDSNGNGYSRYNDIYINRYRYNKNDNGIKIFIKDNNDEIIDVMKNNKLTFTSYSSSYEKRQNDLDVKLQINPLAEYAGEIRYLKISNLSNEDKHISVYVYMEPILTNINDDLSHRVYSNMFLEYTKENNGLIIHRRKKDLSKKDIYFGANVICDNNNLNIDFEIDRYKFIGRNKELLSSNAIKKDIPLSNSTMPTIEPIVAYKLSLIIPKTSNVNIAYIQTISHDLNETRNVINEFSSFDKIKRNIKLCSNKEIVESKFYRYKPLNICMYQDVIEKIINDRKYRVVYNNDLNLMQDNLWVNQISGDKPIILITINRKIEIIFLRQLINMYKYIRSKYIDVNLVIIINSNENYYNEISDEVLRYINMQSLSYDINNNIYILNKNNISKNTLELLDIISVISFNGMYGRLENQFKKIYENDKKNISCERENINNKTKKEIIENIGKKLNLNKEELIYFNEIGGFNKENTNEYKILLENYYSTPLQWSNILANKEFGSIVNENGGGYTWFKNSSQNKMTIWQNDPVLDTPSEYIIIEDDENIYSTTSSPIRIKNTNYLITHSLGYSIYETTFNDIYFKQKVFVPIEDNLKIIELKIKNNSDKIRNLKISYILDILLGNEVTNKIFNIEKYPQHVVINEKYNMNSANKYMYCAGFIQGVDNSVDTTWINVNNLENLNISINTKLQLKQGDEIKVIFLIGGEENKENIEKIINKYKNNVDDEFENIKKYWNELVSKIKIKTPIESMNIMINGWLIYQTLSSRLNARSGYYQSSGAFGFRDQLQDVLSIMYLDPEFAKKQIIYHAKHQYINGDVQHWWHKENNAGVRTRFSDDMLWLAYVTLEYIKITGDKDILNEMIEYIDSNPLEENEISRYEIPQITDKKETLYEHIKKAISISLDFNNENNLPNIGCGDWSDGLSNLFGQSVWLAIFLYDILNKFICFMKDDKDLELYKGKIEILKKGISASWDGRWYKRAFTKDGVCIGSSVSDECKIDSLPQAWSVISNYDDKEKNIIAMESVDNILVDRENKLIKLFYPAFNNTNIEPGYIKSYIPGIRENGGQYTHGAVWNIIAQCILGNGNKAEEYFRIINPIEHALTIQDCIKYKVEPYVAVADIYFADGMIGRGGWSWYTGTASWMYKAVIEYILGLKKEGNILTIDPCINSSWREFEIWYKYEQTNYHIIVKNPNEHQKGIKNIWFDNNKLEENKIELINDKKNHVIEIEM